MSIKKITEKVLLLALVGGCVAIGGVPAAEARDRDNACDQQMRAAENNYEKAVRQHGEHSKQANKRHEKLEQVRARCGHRGLDRDHDRDRDRDHDRDHDRDRDHDHDRR